MREILFRGKQIDNGEWVEGYYAVIGERKVIIALPEMYYDDDGNERYGNEIKDVIPETVCQYTGIKDDNGVKIFENDVVTYLDTYSTDNGFAEANCIGKVVWDSEEACFHVTERLSAESYEVLRDCSVIGNIFDNPELLDKETLND